MAVYWEGAGEVENDLGVEPIDLGNTVEFVPGIYHYTITIVEEDHPTATYATYVGITGDLTGESYANGNFFKVGPTPAPAGGTTVFTGTITVLDNYDVLVDGERANNSGNNPVIPGRQYQMAGSTAGPHGAGNHKMTQITFVISDDAEPPPPPPPAPGIIGEITDADLVSLGDLDHVKRWTCRIELKDVGSGTLVMNRYEDDATDAILKQGNWCKIKIPIVSPDPIWIWQLETGSVVLAEATKEKGGEDATWTGRGGLSILARSKAYNRSFVVPSGIVAGGVYVGPASTGGKAGQLLRRFLDEAQHADRGVVDFGARLDTLDLVDASSFDYDDDSDGNPWIVTPSTADLAQGQVGESGLFSASKLVGTGAIDIIMDPDLGLHAYNAYGRDLTSATFAAGKVRFERGVNVAEKIVRSVGHELAPTHTVVQGQDDIYGYAEDPTASTRPTVEGFVKTQGTDPGFLEEVGLSDMAQRIRKGESIELVVDVGDDELNGKYLPGPPGTNGHFWIGDTVTLDTGSGVYADLNEVAVRIMAIILTTDDANNLKATIEVKWTRLVGRWVTVGGMDGSGGGGAGGGGGTGGGSTTPPPPPSSTLHAHAASAVTFAPTGSIAATNVQSAIAEAASEAQPLDADLTAIAGLTRNRGDLIRGGAAAWEDVALGADGRLLASDGTDAVWEAQYASIVVIIDGGGSAITTGIKGDVRVPFPCVIERASLLADQSGSIVVDIWVDTYANYPPTVADTITASAKPTLSGAIKASDITLTGWTTALAEGSTIRYNVDSAATVQRVMVELKVRKT